MTAATPSPEVQQPEGKSTGHRIAASTASVTDGTALSRGDRNRNDQLAEWRVLAPTENAIVGIDLADDKQAAVVADHHS
jgi:hypothetical protein